MGRAALIWENPEGGATDKRYELSSAPTGYLRKPQAEGFVVPLAVTDVQAAVRDLIGHSEAESVTLRAELFRAPATDEPVRQEKAARLHHAVALLFPARASEVLRAAGAASADTLMTRQLSDRARRMLSAAPWTVAAWLLGRWSAQHSWTFAGSGQFSVLSAMEFEIKANPLAKGWTGAEAPVCDWQEALFERLFQRLVDPRLICREMQCEAVGAPSCQFAFALRDD